MTIGHINAGFLPFQQEVPFGACGALLCLWAICALSVFKEKPSKIEKATFPDQKATFPDQKGTFPDQLCRHVATTAKRRFGNETAFPKRNTSHICFFSKRQKNTYMEDAAIRSFDQVAYMQNCKISKEILGAKT